MLELIQKLYSAAAVSGSEEKIGEAITSYVLHQTSCTVHRDSKGNVVVQKPSLTSEKNSNKNILFIVPLDTPGFLSIRKKDKVYLLPTTRSLPKNLVGQKADFFEYGVFPIQSDAQEPKRTEDHYCLADLLPSYLPGRIYAELVAENGYVSGENISVFARIALLLELMQKEFPHKLSFLFTAQTYGRNPLCGTAAEKVNADCAVLIGCGEDRRVPGIAVREGKYFSDQNLLERANSTEEKFKLERSVFANPITQAMQVAFTGTPTLSLYLPTKSNEFGVEKVKLSDLELLRDACTFLTKDLLI